MKIKKTLKQFYNNEKKSIILALLSTFLLILISYRLHFASYFAIVPLLIIAYRRSFKTTLILSFFIGLVSATIFFTWIYSYRLDIYVAAVIVWTLFYIILAIATNFLYRRMKRFRLLAAPMIWLWIMFLLDLTKYNSYIFEFSMYNAMTAPLIWFIGARGITFVIIMLNSAIAEFFIKKTKTRMLTVSLIALTLLSCFIYSNLAQPEGEQLEIALVQGNFAETWKWRQEHVTEIFDTYKNMSRGIEDSIIIWPEYTLPMDIVNYMPELFNELKYFVKKNNNYLIIGSILFDKEIKNHYDSALLINPKGKLVDIYDSISPAFYNKNTMQGKNGIKLFNINGKKAGIMICAEETASNIAREQTNKGAQFLISISNNQNFSRGIYLSDLYSKLRAVENYKYFVRATNTGITQIITPYGKTYRIEPDKQKILIDKIHLNDHKTPYNWYGNKFIYIITLLFVGFIKKRKT